MMTRRQRNAGYLPTNSTASAKRPAGKSPWKCSLGRKCSDVLKLLQALQILPILPTCVIDTFRALSRQAPHLSRSNHQQPCSSRLVLKPRRICTAHKQKAGIAPGLCCGHAENGYQLKCTELRTVRAATRRANSRQSLFNGKCTGEYCGKEERTSHGTRSPAPCLGN
jgi:hypothetical protein